MTHITLRDMSSRKRPKKAPVALYSEHVEQSLVLKWAELNARRFPDLALLYAIPNGGARHIATAKKLKAEGVKSGVPDLCLPVARGSYHSLYVEMKVGKNTVSDTQKDWHAKLRAAGHAVRVCYSAEAAEQAIENYLAPLPESPL